MFKKGVSYLVLSSFLLMDAVSCIEPEEGPPFSPPRSPRVLRNPPESSANPASSTSSPSYLDSLERLQAISMLPWDEEGQKLRYKLLAEFALKEDTPMTLRQEAFSSIYSTDSLDEVTRKSLEGLRATFLNAEELPFKDRFTFLPNSDEEAAPVTTLLSLTRALESVNDGFYEEWNVLRLIQLLMSYDLAESQEGIERCYFKQPGLFLDGGAYDVWLHTTFEMSNENKRASMLQKSRELLHTSEYIKKVATAAKFILQYSQDTGDKDTTLGTFLNIATQQNTNHSQIPREESIRQKLDISDACNFLLPHAPENKATLLTSLSNDMFQQIYTEISAIIDPQERLQTISRLPWDEGNRLYAELALKEDMPIALRREAFSSIYSVHSLEEVTRERLGNLIITFLSDEEFIDLQEILQMISKLPWDQRNCLHAELALKEDLPMALRRELFSSIDLIESLDEVIKGRLGNLIITFLNDGEFIDLQEILQMISKLPWDQRSRVYAELALKEDIPMASRREAFSSIYSIGSLDEATRGRLENLKITFLNAEELPFKDRFSFLTDLGEEALPLTTLLSLTRALESADAEPDEEWNVLRLIQLLMNYNSTESQEGIERCYFKQPALFLDGSTYEEWLRNTLEMSNESKRVSALQKIREVIYSAEDVKKVAAAAKFILQHSQDSRAQEAATQALWKLVEKKQNLIVSEASEEEICLTRDHAIEACKILLECVPISPIKEPVLQWLFTEAKQESEPKALLILFTQEDPSITSRARQLIEQRINEQRINKATLEYTLKLFIDLQRLNEQNLCNKIFEALKPAFNDSIETDLLTPIARIFLRNTDENLSRRAFEYLTRILTERGDVDNVEDIADDIIFVVEIAHPWAQDVIRIMSGIEQIHNPYSALGAHRQLLEKIKEPVIHHPSSTRLDDGRVVTFDIETLETPRSHLDILPIKHSELLALAEGLRQEVEDPENPKAHEHFSTISTEHSVGALVNRAGDIYFRDLLDSEEEAKKVVNLRSFKLRRLITDIQALKTETQTITEPPHSSSSVITSTSTAPSKNGLSPTSKAIAQLLVNVMQCDTNKDDGIDHTYRLLGYKKVISEEGMREERLLATAREHIMEDLRQMREGLLNGEGVVVKHILFGPTGNQDREIIEPPHKGRYLHSLLGGMIGTSLDGEPVYFDSLSGIFASELFPYTKQQILDILHLYFKPEKVIERYHEQFNKEEGKGLPTSLISTLMGEEMFVMTPEGKMVNDKYSIFDPETWEFKEYTPLLVAEILLRLNILREVRAPSVIIGAPSSSSSMPLSSSSILPSEDSVGGES